MTLWIIGETGIGKAQLHEALEAQGMRDPSIYVFHKSERGYTLGCVAVLPRNVPAPDCTIELQRVRKGVQATIKRANRVLARVYSEPGDAAWLARVAGVAHLLLPELTPRRNSDA